MSFLQIPLGELYDISSGLSKGKAFFGHGFPFLTFKTVFDSFFLPDELAELADTTEKERETCSILRGDVFLTRTSENTDELGMSSVALKDYPNATFNGFTKRLRPKPCVQINPLFASYWFRSTAFRKQVKSMSVMTTRASLNTEMIRRLTMPFPTIEEQDAIANILYPLDEKMAINFTLNHHLRQMAQAIFKSWFVDFVPWGGAMPEDWREGTLKDVCSYNIERIPVTALTTDTYISTENMSANKAGFVRAAILPAITQTTKFKSGDTLVSNIRPYFKKIVLCSFTGGCSTDVLCFRPYKTTLSLYVYNALYSDSFFDHIVSGSKGTKMPRGDKRQIMNYRLVVPSDCALEEFHTVTASLFERIRANIEESTRLATLRNTLLPRLMSGELSVADLTVK